MLAIARRHLLGLIAATVGLCAAAPLPALAQGKQGGTLRYATGTDAQTLDPQFVTDIPTARVVMQLHETLVYPDSKGEMKGVLAESWTVSDDKLTWTFKLRPGVKFHDGTPFNAAAVKFTFDRITNEATRSPRRSSTSSIDSVAVVDDMTVAIRTKTVFAPLLAQLSAYNLAIISPKAGAALNAEYSKAPAGTGPFKLGSWTPSEKMTLARNTDYWGDKAKLDSVEISIVPEDSARVLALLAGQADMIANVPPVMVNRLKGAPNVQVIDKTGFRTIYAAMNLKMKPFDDVRVRQAVAYAIDTKGLLEGVMNKIGTPGGGLESPVIPGAPTLPPYPYDPAKAKALLTEAGYPNGVTVDFYVPTGRYINDRQLGEAIQAQLAKVGIKANLQTPEWGAYSAMLTDKGKIPFFLLGKGSPTGDLDFTLTLNVESKGSGNYGNYSNEAVDKMILEQRATVDPAARREILKKILEQAYNDYPWVVLFYENQLFGQRSNVQGVEVLPNENVFFARATVQ
jgi:peptide/nickel transport system substrate-binding protein